METPVDILTKRFKQLVSGGVQINGGPNAAALSIDEELQRKFVFIPYEEIEAVKIEDTSKTSIHTSLQAGSGPETIRANPDDNPAWLYNSAVHALAMWQHLAREQEKKKSPAPGVYRVTNRTSNISFTAIVNVDQRIKVVARDTGTLTDQTDSMRTSISEFEWSRIDTTTGTITN